MTLPTYNEAMTLDEIHKEIALLEQIDRGAYESPDLTPLVGFISRRYLLIRCGRGRQEPSVVVRLSKEGREALETQRLWLKFGSRPTGEQLGELMPRGK
jgi:hypothetical protein